MKNNIGAFIMVGLFLLFSVQGCGGYKPAAKVTRLGVYLADPYWDSVTFPPGERCKKLGGKGATPALWIRDIPDGANLIIMSYSDKDSPAMNNGGLGVIGYRIEPGTSDVYVPPVPGNTFKMPDDNFIVIEPHRNQVPAWGSIGAYLPPCSGTEGHEIYVRVKAVYHPFPKKKLSEAEKLKALCKTCPEPFHLECCEQFEEATKPIKGCKDPYADCKPLDEKKGCGCQGDKTAAAGSSDQTPPQKSEAPSDSGSSQAGQAASGPAASSGSAAQPQGAQGSGSASQASSGAGQATAGQADGSKPSGKPAAGGAKDAEGKPLTTSADAPPRSDLSDESAKTPPTQDPVTKTTAKVDDFKYVPVAAHQEPKPKFYKTTQGFLDEYRSPPPDCPAYEPSDPKKKKEDPKAKKKLTRPTLLATGSISMGTIPLHRGKGAPEKK